MTKNLFMGNLVVIICMREGSSLAGQLKSFHSYIRIKRRNALYAEMQRYTELLLLLSYNREKCGAAPAS